VSKLAGNYTPLKEIAQRGCHLQTASVIYDEQSMTLTTVCKLWSYIYLLHVNESMNTKLNLHNKIKFHTQHLC